MTALSLDDVVQIYDTRIALEGMAAEGWLLPGSLIYLIWMRRSQLGTQRCRVENVRSYCERDLAFHLLLCEKSGNPFSPKHLTRLKVPFFAFCVLSHNDAPHPYRALLGRRKEGVSPDPALQPELLRALGRVSD